MLGMLAMLIAYLPGVVAGSSAKPLPDCCNGVMCPMHKMAGDHVICGVDLQHRDGAFQSCPDLSQHYTPALAFLRIAPAVFFSQRVLDSAATLAPQVAAKVDAEVPYPPPRTFPA